MPPKISSSEWEVMNALWAHAGPCTAGEVFAALPAGHDWHPKTVNTFLTRLAAKGAVAITKDGHINRYSARLGREECVTEESRGFLERIFGGAAGPMLLHFCENAELTDAEIAELQKLLKKKKAKR